MQVDGQLAHSASSKGLPLALPREQPQLLLLLIAQPVAVADLGAKQQGRGLGVEYDGF